jgi:epoxide hydrolase 4
MQASTTFLGSNWQHQYIKTNDIKLHCVSQGEGELLILLHGFPEFWYSWRHQIEALSRYFKVVVPDMRGYNYSDKPASGYDIDTLTADIRGAIASLGYGKAYIVGHDWGGAIAWNLAEKFPHLVEKLAILNAPHPQKFFRELTTNFEQIAKSWYILAFQIPGLPEWLIQQNLADFVKQVFRGQAVRKGAFTGRDHQIYEEALSRPGVLSAALNYYRQLLSPSQGLIRWGQKGQPITVPTLVLWGQEDPFLGKKLLEGLEKLVVAPFELKIIPDCGHWIQQEVPQVVNRELLKFFRSTDLEEDYTNSPK